jgi:hypothetical protein
MKKTLCLFGAVMIASVALTSCTKEEVPEKPKNYYGVEPSSNGTPKEAYYALFGAIVIVLALVSIGLRKLRNKR